MQQSTLTAIGLSALLLAIGTAGCGSGEEVTEEETVAPDTVRVPEPVRFETQIDTVHTQRNSRPAVTSPHTIPEGIRFMVQIGAFKNPRNASTLQQEARARFHQPVLNDYHTTYSLYQIRIGFFATREEAEQFKHHMQEQFPGDYRDAWVVQLKR
jgi:cell division septation protein DedD